MASQATLEASEIRRRGRQRLIGAIAIVLLLVVFVPMVLDSEPRPVRTEPVMAIPPKDAAKPLAPPPPAAAPVATPPKAPEAAPAKVEAPAAPTPAAAPVLEGFVVQVGAFRDEAKLRSAREKLQASGVVHYTERLETKSGPLTRLRAGPFPTREAAESALATLKRNALEGKVVPLP